ncbi:hypothetical protein [Pseudomonas amygdali]|uniref:Uncharacterized protein n=1 Tax=Pseudomonas amygdali pv. lachrymans str. M301315 TaxID=629260 RepID=A0AAD0PVW5_PSEAV|nr:hypothetical protein [Pseudomonas amygdali]AXH59718.1 hypothetical protein PLA107_031340 [Pseudomonas amygdali pv. lachrymans str. M301315]RMT06036.1 hypothetical protein ALP54_03624 [Pseudomonas amygdali pv. lachrymans]
MSKPIEIKHSKVVLAERLGSSLALGAAAGLKVGIELSGLVYSNLGPHVVELSLAGIEAIDCAFFEEAVYKRIGNLTQGAAIYLSGIESPDVARTCELTARALGRYLVIEDDQTYRIAGLDLRPGEAILVEAVYDKGMDNSRDIADAYDLSVANASTRLKDMLQKGLVLRAEVISDTGGYEYRYFPIGHPRSRKS